MWKRERVWHFLISHQVFGAAGLAYKQRWFLCHNWALQIRSISSAAAGPVRLPSHQHLRTRRRPGVTCMADDKGISGTVRWGTTAELRQWQIQPVRGVNSIVPHSFVNNTNNNNNTVCFSGGLFLAASSHRTVEEREAMKSLTCRLSEWKYAVFFSFVLF